mgnify:CR=1 FL=1
MSSPSDSPTLLDSTVLSNFGYIDEVHLLEDLPRVGTVPEVEKELKHGADSYPYLQNAVDVLEEEIPVLTPTSEETEKAIELSNRLDPGESEVIAVAELREGTVVTDDRTAREVSREKGVSVTGSIGVLISSIEQEKIGGQTADRWLKKWVEETGYRAPSKDLSDYL